MKKKKALIIGILGVLLLFGAAVAMAQNTSSETKDAENHEFTSEMMESMSENSPREMMQSDECENMMDGEEGHAGMMDSSSPASNADAEETDHCGGMDSDMGSMMGSGGVDMRRIM